MKASIIIAHLPGRSVLLDRLLDSIHREASEDSVEILIESDGSKSESRNLLASHAKAEILVFWDDDVMLRPGCLQELLDPFSDPGVGVVSGVNIAFPDIDFREQISSSLYSSPLAMARSSARYTPRGNIRETDESEVISCCMAVRSKAFQEAGGFPLDIIPCEENVLINRIQKLGYKIVYNPFAVVYHRRPRIWREYAATMFDFGVGRALMFRKGEGSPRMLWRPGRKWPFYAAALVLHYISYSAGFLSGLIKPNHKTKALNQKLKSKDKTKGENER